LTLSLLRIRMRKDDQKLVSEAIGLMVRIVNRRRPDRAGSPTSTTSSTPDPLEGLSDAQFRDYLLAQLEEDVGAEEAVERTDPTAAGPVH
jgi:hypothetical protein